MNTVVPSATRVRLDVNSTGLWHTVLTFDAADPLAEAQIRAGVEALAAVDRATAFRVIQASGPGRTLLTYSSRFGWHPT